MAQGRAIMHCPMPTFALLEIGAGLLCLGVTFRAIVVWALWGWFVKFVGRCTSIEIPAQNDLL